MPDETIELLKASAAAFAAEAPDVSAPAREWAQAFAAQGWLGILAGEDRGGLGLGPRHAAAVATVLGGRAIASPFVSLSMAARCLAALPGPSAALALMIEGEITLAPAWRWPFEGATSPLPQFRNGRLSGEVAYVPMPDADGFLVEAQSHAGPVLFHVLKDDPGVTCEAETCADGSRLGTLLLTDVPLEEGRVLAEGEAALAAIGEANRIGLLLAAAELAGVVDGSLQLTLEYLRTRRQFGTPIGSFQVLQHRAVDMWLQQSLIHAAVEGTLAAEEAPPGTDDRDARVLAAKIRAGQGALSVTSQALQLHGAIGFAAEYALGAFINRALTLAPWLGNAAQLRALFPRHAQRADPLPSSKPASLAEAVPTDWNSLSDGAFRAMIREEFERYYPPQLRFPARRLRWNENGDWYRRMAAKGWIAPNWPVEHGGMGLSAGKLLAFVEEQERHGIARFQDHGILMVGPVLMRYGSEQQRQRFLPPILRCEHIWCQGYSEPDSGSDLASLKMRAVADGSDFVITGQKIWTTLAQDATHIFVLARTDPDAKPQQGISFILVDMKSPGIRVRPIRDIAGNEEFCEVFFDSVRVPRENLVGAENEGWTIAKSLLGFERISLGSPKLPEFGLQVLHALAQAQGVEDDAVVVDQIAQLRIDVMHLADLYASFAGRAVRGETLGPDVSSLKIVATELFQRIADLVLSIAGPAGGIRRVSEIAGLPIDCLGVFYKSRPATIYGGSNEIQRNILAKAVLDLPSATRR